LVWGYCRGPVEHNPDGQRPADASLPSLLHVRARISRAGLAAAFVDLALATLFLGFAYAQLRSFLRQPRASVLLIVAVETLFAVFFVLRRSPSATSSGLVASLSTVLGTLLPLLLRPVPGAGDLLAAQLVQIAGGALAVAGILSLNRSIGLLPANRGVRSGGAYRLVRHPLYASYLVSHLGYVASNLDAWNVAVTIAALCAQLVRIRGEERLLSVDPAYAAYRARTRWRLVPFVY
jgi:protein-S-isoprenylcysteine O-methyltransferase Ste14